jgi:hypothetical protein
MMRQWRGTSIIARMPTLLCMTAAKFSIYCMGTAAVCVCLCRLLHEVVTERRCKDNCTVMLVLLDH